MKGENVEVKCLVSESCPIPFVFQKQNSKAPTISGSLKTVDRDRRYYGVFHVPPQNCQTQMCGLMPKCVLAPEKCTI